MLPRISEQELIPILTEKLGLYKGAVVFIHSSVDRMRLDFPLYKLLQILLDIVGREEGSLIFPTAHFDIRAEEYLTNNSDTVIFDVRKSPTVRGLLPEIARRKKNAVRSLHPTESIAVIGKYASELTETHHQSIYPCGELSPFYKMMKYNGLIIGMGVSIFNLSFVHCVEDVMKDRFPIKTRIDKEFDCKVRNYEGDLITVKTLAAHQRITHHNVLRFFKRYIPANICKQVKFKNVDFFVADSNALFNKMEALAGEKKTIYTKKAFIR